MISMSVGLAFSIIAFVSVTVLGVIISRNSSKLLNLRKDALAHREKNAIDHNAQERSVRNLVDSVNYNDQIGNRENIRLNRYIKNVELDTNTKMNNIDDNLNTFKKRTDKNLETLDKNIKDNIEIVDDKAKYLYKMNNDLDDKYKNVTSSNLQYTKDEVHRNYDYINSNVNDINRVIAYNDERYKDRFDSNQIQLNNHEERITINEDSLNTLETSLVEAKTYFQEKVDENNDNINTNLDDIKNLQSTKLNKSVAKNDYVQYNTDPSAAGHRGLNAIVSDLQTDINTRVLDSTFNSFKVGEYANLQSDVTQNISNTENIDSKLALVQQERNTDIRKLTNDLTGQTANINIDLANNQTIQAMYLKTSDLANKLEVLRDQGDQGMPTNVINQFEHRLEDLESTNTSLQNSFVNSMFGVSDFDTYFRNTTSGSTLIDLDDDFKDHESKFISFSNAMNTYVQTDNQRNQDLKDLLQSMSNNLLQTEGDIDVKFATKSNLNNNYYKKTDIDSKITNAKTQAVQEVMNAAPSQFKGDKGNKGDTGVSVGQLYDEYTADGVKNMWFSLVDPVTNQESLTNKIALPVGPSGTNGTDGKHGDRLINLTVIPKPGDPTKQVLNQEWLTFDATNQSTSKTVTGTVNIKGDKGVVDYEQIKNNFHIGIADDINQMTDPKYKTICMFDSTTTSPFSCIPHGDLQNLFYTKDKYVLNVGSNSLNTN